MFYGDLRIAREPIYRGLLMCACDGGWRLHLRPAGRLEGNSSSNGSFVGVVGCIRSNSFDAMGTLYPWRTSHI